MVIAIPLLKQLIKDLNLLVKRLLIENGIEKDSDLVKSVEFIVKDNGLAMLANDYYTYASTGRKPGARKVPISDLIVWIKKYKIGSGDVNQTAWKIQQAIYKNGIKGKKYLDKITDSVADLSSENLAGLLADAIANDMVKAFKPS